ncbi:MAG: YfhO family protein, partial [Acidobacteria bacterium]|nr:YfhO family protein [Acidobacteriota bacterium]
SRPDARVALTAQGPLPTELHFYGLNTPQGFDPMLPAQYKQAIEAHTVFRTDRLFDLDPAGDDLLRLLAVRYYVADESGPLYPVLAANPNFRPLAPSSKTFFRAFEYMRARPPYYWDPDTGGSIERVVWTPERREFLVRSKNGGRLVLAEQFFPGWQATVDHTPVRIERWRGAFQAIEVPSGEQRVRFVFRSLGLRVGAVVTLLSLVGLAILNRPAMLAGRV